MYDGTTHAILDGRPIDMFKIGNTQPTPLNDYIEALEGALGRRAQGIFLPTQPDDVPATSANTEELDAWVGLNPATPVRGGVRRCVEWYREFYCISQDEQDLEQPDSVLQPRRRS